ncbi:MAG: glucose-1-phosphate adenylyltransferase subunit GlgD, partial [Bacilli bacterium]
ARCFDSLEHFVEYSFELLDYRFAHQLFDHSWPIYTITHDTPPALYGTKASVRDSFVANGAIVEGKVERSIISRNVKIGRGSIVRDSIVLTNTTIGENAVISHCVVDKYCAISDGVHIEGTKTTPHYVEQGKKL